MGGKRLKFPKRAKYVDKSKFVDGSKSKTEEGEPKPDFKEWLSKLKKKEEQ